MISCAAYTRHACVQGQGHAIRLMYPWGPSPIISQTKQLITFTQRLERSFSDLCRPIRHVQEGILGLYPTSGYGLYYFLSVHYLLNYTGLGTGAQCLNDVMSFINA